MRTTILILALVGAAVALTAADAAAQTNGSSGGFFSGLFGNSSPPAPPPSAAEQNSDDPTLLKNGPKKAGVALYVSVVRLYTETGKYTEAEDQYNQAAKIAPDDIRVLLGLAMLKDQMNDPAEALKLYQQAEKKHPKEPAVYNNLAVHFIRQGMVPEAIEAALHAVELRPHEPRYRNNLAALYVEAGQPQEAFKQLRAVYEEPVAHYDLGFLLNKRGLKPAALQEFMVALQMSPGMGLARQWVERLSRERAEHEVAASAMPQQRWTAPTGPDSPYPRAYAAETSAPLPPQYAAPPQYRMVGAPPAQVQNPLPPQAQPAQNQPPPYRAPSPAAPPANAVPMTAARDPDVRLMPPEGNGVDMRRLPPVNSAERAAPDFDQLAPDPPDLRR